MMKFCLIIKIMFQIIAVQGMVTWTRTCIRGGPWTVLGIFVAVLADQRSKQPCKGLHRIEHVLQAAFTSLELQSAHCPLNFDLLTLKQSCTICDQITRMVHFKPLKIKTACKTLNKYRCCEPIKMVR